MIITTTQDVPGMEIVEYRGLATGEVVAGINFLKDIGARLLALKELEERAEAMGANAVIGIRIDFDGLGNNGSNMLLVTVTGTAVVVR